MIFDGDLMLWKIVLIFFVEKNANFQLIFKKNKNILNKDLAYLLDHLDHGQHYFPTGLWWNLVH